MTHAKELPPITADANTMAEARANCAARAMSRGEIELAESYMRGEQDAGWAIRHEVALLLAGRD